MGLIRKTLAVSTLGVVHGSSKKQRVAKATMKSSAVAAAALQQQAAAAAAAARHQAAAADAAARHQAAMDAAALRLAEQKAAEDREFRYATDPVYRKFIDDKRAAEEAERVARDARIEAERVAQAARIEAERVARAARIEEADRLRRLRNQRRVASAKKALTLMGRAVAILVVGVVVWVPQLTVGLIRRKPADKWMYAQLVRRPEPPLGQLNRPA
jgi:hypothetical protein